MIPLFKSSISPTAHHAVAGVLSSGMTGEGPRVAEFTDLLADRLQTPNVVALNSCTSALVLALRLAGDAPDVISPSFTFPATNCAIKDARCNIIWGHHDTTTECLSIPQTIDQVKRENKLRAVVLTLVGGVVPHDLEVLHQECVQNGVALILDAAHAFGTTYKGKPICHYADFTCFSFQSIKHLTTGDGGALVVREPLLLEKAERLKWFGMSRVVPEGMTKVEHQMTYSIPDWGYKFHMNDIAAAIGISNLTSPAREEMSMYDWAVKRSRENAARYTELLGEDFYPQETADGSDPTRWVYGFRCWNQHKIMAVLQEAGFQSSTLWMDNKKHSCFLNGGKIPFGSHHMLYIPSGHWVSDTQVEEVADIIKKVSGV